MSDLIRKSVQAMKGYVPGEQPNDPQIIKLNTNENPYPPTPKIKELLADFDIAELRKYPNPVSLKLRQALAELHGCSVDEIFVGNGSDEVLALCIRTFVERNGSVGYFDPSYSLYPVLTEIEDLEKRPVALNDDFSWQMPADFESSLFLLTNPNAPTSLSFDKEKVRNFIANFNGVVLVDEAYADFAEHNCMDLALEFENCIVSRTFSKSFSLAGIRLGYCVGSPELIGAMHKIKDSYNVDMLTQAIGLTAIEDYNYMLANAAKIKATRAKTVTALTDLGFEVLPSQTNFLWVKPAEKPAAEIFSGLKSRKIFVRYFTDPKIKDYLRITIGTNAEMDALLTALKELI